MNKRTNDKKKIISFIPDGELYRKLANRSVARGERSTAQRYFERALERRPEDAELLKTFGIFLLEQSDMERAYDLLVEAHGALPEDEEVVFHLADLHARLGLVRGAKQYAEQYAELAPEGPLITETMEILEFADYEVPLRTEEELFSEEVFFQQEKAQRAMEEGRFEEAALLLERILETYPNYLAASNNLALAYFYVQRPNEAKQLLRDVLRIESGNVHALCNLAIFSYYLNEAEELEKLQRVLVKIQPYHVDDRYKLGATFALIGEYKLAYRWLKPLRARESFAVDPAYYFWLSHAAYFSGYLLEAKRYYARLVEIDPTKEGEEPWRNIETDTVTQGLEHNWEFLHAKLNSSFQSDRLLALFLLGKSMHRFELLNPPHTPLVETFNTYEQLYFAYALEPSILEKGESEEQMIGRSIEVANVLYRHYAPIASSSLDLLGFWFQMCTLSYANRYTFPNPNALAAASVYLFSSVRHERVTKKEVAEQYGIAPSTLTKYVDILIEQLPLGRS